MINLLLLLIFLSCIGISAAWIAENPGDVTIHWHDYQIDTSFAFLLLLGVIGAVVLAYGYMLLRKVILAPSHFSERRSLRHYKKGLTELTYSVAALAAADTKNAELHTRKAEKLLGRTPLTLLLSAQVARSQGDDAKTRLLLDQMLDYPETEYLAARSLSEAASKQEMLPQALELARRAQALNPQGTTQVVGLHIRLGQWQQAANAVQRAARKCQITRGELRHYKGIIHLQQGMQALEAGHIEGAMLAAKHCVKELPGFAPALLFAARAYAQGGQESKAVKLIASHAKKHPHPQLTETLRRLIRDWPKTKQEKLLAPLTATASDDSAWACSACGQASPEWEAHCPSCGAFDTLEWKKREMRFSEGL